MTSRLFQIPAGALFVLALAVSSADAQVPENPNLAAPALRYSTVKGDAGKFQEDWWIRDGQAGGPDASHRAFFLP